MFYRCRDLKAALTYIVVTYVPTSIYFGQIVFKNRKNKGYYKILVGKWNDL